MLEGKGIDTVELSALRKNELTPLARELDSLELSNYTYVSVHAPSQFEAENERPIVETLLGITKRGWPVIVHPDAIYDYSLWRELGSWLCIENMDKRKPIGRTVEELETVFREIPESSFCFDIGHARQFDSTMTEAYLLLKAFGGRLRQVHLSEVNTSSRHDALSSASILAFRQVAHLIPEGIPVILECPVPEDHILSEIRRARTALPDAPSLSSGTELSDNLILQV